LPIFEQGGTDVSNRLTDVRLEIGLDDDDHSKIGLMVSGNVRDDTDMLTSQYRRDISDELTPQMRQALNQIFTRIVDRVLKDHKLTRADMEAGRQAHADRKAAEMAAVEADAQSRRQHDEAHMAEWAAAEQEAEARFAAIRAEEERLTGPAEELAERLRQEGEAAQQPPQPKPEETPA